MSSSSNCFENEKTNFSVTQSSEIKESSGAALFKL